MLALRFTWVLYSVTLQHIYNHRLHFSKNKNKMNNNDSKKHRPVFSGAATHLQTPTVLAGTATVWALRNSDVCLAAKLKKKKEIEKVRWRIRTWRSWTWNPRRSERRRPTKTTRLKLDSVPLFWFETALLTLLYRLFCYSGVWDCYSKRSVSIGIYVLEKEGEGIFVW